MITKNKTSSYDMDIKPGCHPRQRDTADEYDPDIGRCSGHGALRGVYTGSGIIFALLSLRFRSFSSANSSIIRVSLCPGFFVEISSEQYYKNAH